MSATLPPTRWPRGPSLHRAYDVFGRLWGRVILPTASVDTTGRLAKSVERAELAGLVFAFRARLLGTGVVSIVLLLLVSWPRNGWYLGFSAAFFLLGVVPYCFCHSRHAEVLKLAFVVLDVVLVSMAILVPPPDGISIDWPVQTRLRGQTFLFLLVLLGEAALTYSPRRVLWTGSAIVLVWTAGFMIVNGLSTTLRYSDVVASGDITDRDLLRMFVDPRYVSSASLVIQLVATALFTLLLTLSVLRSRHHLLAQVRFDALRSDLARYVSPDVADVVTERVTSGLDEPTTRDVAVLFADIVGFTGRTEGLSPDRAFALLRSFQQRSSGVVLDHGGTIDKYLGDGLMATFGALREDPEAAARAVACAFALDREVARWNVKRCERGADAIRLAIGLHFGSAMVGHLGSDRHVEFTVVGDVVNAASRLEKATRELGCRLVVSDACLRAAGNGVRAIGVRGSAELTLRGRREQMTVHLYGAWDEAVDHLGPLHRMASTNEHSSLLMP